MSVRELARYRLGKRRIEHACAIIDGFFARRRKIGNREGMQDVPHHPALGRLGVVPYINAR